MQLGAFSISLNVKDLDKSIVFYETLGFTKMGGDADHGYVIMKNGDTLIGLFMGMFDKNMLTFNPGWDSNAENVDPFTDVRDIQKHLEAAGIDIVNPAAPDSEGPASFIIHDPDGNPILIDQHR